MINYLEITRKMRKVEGIPEDKKNRIIRNAILTEIVNIWKPILKAPFYLIQLVFELITLLFEKAYDLGEIIVCFLNRIREKINNLPVIHIGNQEESEEMIKAFRKQYREPVKQADASVAFNRK